MNHEIKSYDQALAFLEGERERIFSSERFPNVLFNGGEGATIRVIYRGEAIIEYKPNGNITLLPKIKIGMVLPDMIHALSAFTPFEYSGNQFSGYEVDTGKDQFMMYTGMTVEPSGWLED